MPTNEELERAALEKKIEGIYAQAKSELEEKIAKALKGFEVKDKKKLRLLEDGKISEEQYKAWRRNQLLAIQTDQGLADGIAERLLKADEIAAAYINEELPKIYLHGINDIGAQAEAVVQGFSFDVINEEAVRNLTVKGETILPYKHVDGKKVVRWNTQKVNSAVLQSVLQGEAVPKLAKRLVKVCDMNEVSAKRNAQTAYTSALNRGRADGIDSLNEKGIKTIKVWSTIMSDHRARHAHEMLHQQEADENGVFHSELGDIRYPGDPEAKPENVYNCRCSVAGRIDIDSLEKKNAGEEETVDNAEQKEENARHRTAVSDELDAAGVEYKPFGRIEGELTDEKVIGELAGGDMTEGSCASLALAYIGRKNGYDVLDFRDGESRSWFAKPNNNLNMWEPVGVKNVVYSSFKTGVANAKQALASMVEGKEYYFTCGKHAAITRVVNGQYQYLELQSEYNNILFYNGWHNFVPVLETKVNVTKVLNNRFSANASTRATIADISECEGNKEFFDVLGYINTEPDKQVKGNKGGIK